MPPEEERNRSACPCNGSGAVISIADWTCVVCVEGEKFPCFQCSVRETPETVTLSGEHWRPHFVDGLNKAEAFERGTRWTEDFLNRALTSHPESWQFWDGFSEGGLIR